MAEPPEVCPEHDTVISEHGCWACGHAGPLNSEEHRQYVMWVGE